MCSSQKQRPAQGVSARQLDREPQGGEKVREGSKRSRILHPEGLRSEEKVSVSDLCRAAAIYKVLLQR